MNEPTYAWEVADDYETRIQAAEDKAGSLAADLIEERAQRREVGEALVRVTEERDGWKQALEELRERSTRARQQHFRLLDEYMRERAKLLSERDEARDEVVRLGREGEELLAALMEANNNRMALVVQHIKALAEIKRLRTIIGEVGAAEAAEPPWPPAGAVRTCRCSVGDRCNVPWHWAEPPEEIEALRPEGDRD